ncbi:MAG: DUF2798 domain-containing protein [Hyphomicrobiaceae bacterium]|nr:DUF2798 domain-containing protein [Hyphomicrobiaceae bacterium]
MTAPARTSGFPKVPHRYHAVVMPFFLSIMMTFIISGISTLMGVGLTPAFPAKWLAAWGLSWVIAFPTLLMVLPLVRRLTALVVAPPPSN